MAQTFRVSLGKSLSLVCSLAVTAFHCLGSEMLSQVNSGRNKVSNLIPLVMDSSQYKQCKELLVYCRGDTGASSSVHRTFVILREKPAKLLRLNEVKKWNLFLVCFLSVPRKLEVFH